MEQSKPIAYVFEGFRLDPLRRLLFNPEGQPVFLPPRAFDTLCTSSSAPDTAGSRDLGSVSAVYPDGRGRVWVAERCGRNDCAEREELDPLRASAPDSSLGRMASTSTWTVTSGSRTRAATARRAIGS